MAFLRDLFSKDPSRHWSPPREQALKFDISSSSLNGMAIGAPLESLREMGRPENKNPFHCEDFSYDSLGFSIGGEHGKVVDFCFMFDSAIHRSSRKSPLKLTMVLPGGANIALKRGTQPSSLLPIFGAPAETEIDEEYPDEPDYTYHFPLVQLLFCFDKAGLVTLDVDPRE